MAEGLERIQRLARQLGTARAVKPKKLLVTDEEHRAVFDELIALDRRSMGVGFTKDDAYRLFSGELNVLGIRLVRPRDWGRVGGHG